jgi:hypothetical protein
MAPVAVSVDELPAQMFVGEAEAVTVGLGLTIRFRTCVLEQAPVTPVTVYCVVMVGETTTLLPVSDPGIQV